ncbi:MAG: hypothetical protein H0T46_22795 [Deltaproteobacteria bacterium]|nr:hypothetical protein [Deltaproteobacteria bacterium]
MPRRAVSGGHGEHGAGAPATGVVERLHAELATVGVVTAGTADGFGTATAVALTEFQRRYRLPEHGNLDPTTGGVLALAALVATSEEPARLAAELGEARGRVADSLEYDRWLARFAIAAGAFDVAAAVGTRIEDLWGRDFSAVLDGGRAAEPEVPFPENYYTYRYPLMAQTDIDELRRMRTAGSTGRIIFMRPMQPGASTRDLPAVEPPPPLDPPPEPQDPPDGEQSLRLANAAEAWLAAVEAWQVGNAELAKRRYATAAAAYETCQRAALAYFAWNPLYHVSYTTSTLARRVDELLWLLAGGRQSWPQLWQHIEWRRQLISLGELLDVDWIDPFRTPPIRAGGAIYETLRANLVGVDGPTNPSTRISLLDGRMLVLATVLVPLARGEANRLRRQYAAARRDFELVLRRRIPDPRADSRDALQLTPGLLCERIEVPFARLMLIETLLEQAETQYKARTRVEDLPEAERQAATDRLGVIAADLAARLVPADPQPGAVPLQHLTAAITYAEVFATIEHDGEYAQRATQALDDLSAAVGAVAVAGGTAEVQAAARGITLPTVNLRPATSASGAHPHEALVEMIPPTASPMREANPRVYGLLLQAQARLLQIWSGFNYLGYPDSYTPPWRFAFLLDRARYFAEHAKNAQRDYLNFLSNAENEELRELSTAQNVELEKANVAIETARVEHGSREVMASRASAAMADLTARDAQQRLDDYDEFDSASNRSGMFETLGAALVAGAVAGATGDVGGLVGVVHSAFGNDRAAAQRDLEMKNLELAIGEAKQGKRVAQAQLDVAKAGLVVAGLQRQAALLRHAQALQTLQFMRNRSLNAEQWDRLAAAIRGVADIYLRYAIEIAFLAQQAYNFEADKRLDVIRFDYDVSDLGAMLAADFLLRDLDTLEQDHLVTNKARLQQLRYVVSLARDYPEALRTLAEDGSVTFSVRLEQLERHFPGMIGLRITSVELQPLALMDPTRVTTELTQLGCGAIRLRQQPGGSPLDAADLLPGGDWLGTAGDGWPIKLRIAAPESALFTGLARAEAAAASAITAEQRGAFEGLPAASSWRLDLSAAENQIVPGTLADCLLTFVLGGTHDPTFKHAVTSQVARTSSRTTTRMLSARRMFPDAYYSLVRYGRMSLSIVDRHLSAAGTPAELRNLSIALPLRPDGPHLGRSYCRYAIELEVAPGIVTVRTPLPNLVFSTNGLVMRCLYSAAAGPAAAEVSWDLGDRAELLAGGDVQHAYARPGRYEIRARLVHDHRLTEYRASVVVSGQHATTPPLVVTPSLVAGQTGADGTVPITISVPTGSGLAIECTTGSASGSSTTGTVELSLPIGRHVLRFAASRSLSTHFFGMQRHVPTTPVVFERGRKATNRTFDLDGNETTSAPNDFTGHVFDGRVISPIDRWTLEMPIASNPWFRSVTSGDIEEVDCSELADAVIALEFVERA